MTDRKAGRKQVDQREMDEALVREIAAEEGGEAILKCYACGTCTAICPVAFVDERFSPRAVIRMAILGMREELLSSEFPWLCAGCYSCSERCPQGVKVTDIMRAIARIAAREGRSHRSIIAALDRLEKEGRLTEISEFEQTMREKSGLEPLENERVKAEVKRLIEATKVRKRVRGKEGGDGGDK